MLNVRLDTKRLEQWAKELSARGLKNAARRAVDQSATAARRKALATIAQDIGVAPARVKEAVGRVKRTTQSSLSASFVTSKQRISIRNVYGAKIGKGGLSASTYRLSPGGSTMLIVKDAFLIRSRAGGVFVAVRRGPERLPIKSIFAQTPSNSMGTGDGAAQVAWQKAANAELSQRLPRELNRQFMNERLSATSAPDSGD